MIPKSLRVVAVIHLVCGWLAAGGIVLNLSHGRLIFDFNVLGIPIYYGLMRLSSSWRTCALVLLWCGLIFAPCMFILGLTARSPAYIQSYGVRLADIPAAWMSVAAVPVFLLALWQYRVLTRPEIRSLFLQPSAAPTTR